MLPKLSGKYLSWISLFERTESDGAAHASVSRHAEKTGSEKNKIKAIYRYFFIGFLSFLYTY